MLLKALWRTLTQIFAPEVLSAGLKSALLVILGFALLWGIIGWVLANWSIFSGWLEIGADAGIMLLTVFMSLLAFPIILPLVASLFQESVVGKIAARDYPALGPVRDVPLRESLWRDVKFLAVALPVNLFALPLYLFPLTSIPASIIINGYLLGREMFGLTASLFVSAEEAELLRRRHQKTVWMAGAAMAGMMLLFPLNLLAPVLGVVLMLHLYAALRQEASPAIASIAVPAIAPTSADEKGE